MRIRSPIQQAEVVAEGQGLGPVGRTRIDGPRHVTTGALARHDQLGADPGWCAPRSRGNDVGVAFSHRGEPRVGVRTPSARLTCHREKARPSASKSCSARPPAFITVQGLDPPLLYWLTYEKNAAAKAPPLPVPTNADTTEGEESD